MAQTRLPRAVYLTSSTVTLPPTTPRSTSYSDCSMVLGRIIPKSLCASMAPNSLVPQTDTACQSTPSLSARVSALDSAKPLGTSR